MCCGYDLIRTQHEKFIEFLKDKDVSKIGGEVSRLHKDGSQANYEFSNLVTNFHKQEFGKYGLVDVSCNDKKCGPGNGLGGYYWWRMGEELSNLREYSGMGTEKIAEGFEGLKIDFKELETALGTYEEGLIELDRPMYGKGRTVLPHEFYHHIEHSLKYGDDPDYARVQDEGFRGTEWMTTMWGKELSYKEKGKRMTYRKGEGFKYEDFGFEPHMFTKRCSEEGCVRKEFTTEGHDLFSRPEEALIILNKGSDHYMGLRQKAEEELRATEPKTDEEWREDVMGRLSPKREFYKGLKRALDPKNLLPEKYVHPADFLTRSLGHQLVEGFMSPDYCSKHFGGHCSAAIDSHMAIVKKLYKKGEISEDYLEAREEVADRLEQQLP